jgi:hypothetical protein
MPARVKSLICVCLILCALISEATSAAWTKANTSSAGTTYIDRDTILRAGDKVKVWELTDYDEVPVKQFPYLSTKRHSEYDCKEKKYRLISISSHSGHMGTGEVMITATNYSPKWEPLLPGSTGQLVMKLSCFRRRKGTV